MDEPLKPGVKNQIKTIQIEEEATTDQVESEEPLIIMGRCEYRKISGQAEILVVQKINQFQLEVKFNFLPDNADEAENYRFPNIKDSEHSIIINFKQEQEDELLTSFVAGSFLQCFRFEKMSGTCSPVVFKIAGFD